MDISHVIDHLISPVESAVIPSMTVTLVFAIDLVLQMSIVHVLHVALQICFARKLAFSWLAMKTVINRTAIGRQ